MNALCSRRPHIRGDPEPRETRVKIIHVLHSPHSSPERRCAAHSACAWYMVHGGWWDARRRPHARPCNALCGPPSTVHSRRRWALTRSAWFMVHGGWWDARWRCYARPCEALRASQPTVHSPQTSAGAGGRRRCAPSSKFESISLSADMNGHAMRNVARFAVDSPQSTDDSRRCAQSFKRQVPSSNRVVSALPCSTMQCEALLNSWSPQAARVGSRSRSEWGLCNRASSTRSNPVIQSRV